jgi:hypothetical protein
MTIRELARALEISPALVYRLLRRGMPREVEAAKEWRARTIRARATPAAKPAVVIDMSDESRPGVIVELVDADGYAGMIERLRRLEKDLAAAAGRAFRADRVAEAITLRREHVAAVKAIYETEAKSIKIDEARGRLVSVDRALNLINDAMQSAILVLRRLPELGRDPEERRRLESFLNGILSEIKSGAVEGFNRTGPSSERAAV